MSLHKEISFETEICQHLADHGWLYAEGDAAGYDRARALFPADVLAWVQATQPQAWETLTKNHGSKAEEPAIFFQDLLKPHGSGSPKTSEFLEHWKQVRPQIMWRTRQE